MKFVLKILFLFFTILILGACTNKSSNIENLPTEKREGIYYPITVTDLNNKKTIINKKPERIVVLSTSAAEMVYNLGYGQNIVGVSEQCNYPKELSRIKKVANFSDVDMELIKDLNPDIIFTGKFIYESINNGFLENKIPVVYIDSESYTGVHEALDILGTIFNEAKKTGDIKKSLTSKIEVLTKNISIERKNILYIQSIEPLYAAGAKTLVNDSIYIAGGANAALGVDGYSKIDESIINQKKVDIILLSNQLSKDINLEYLKKHHIFKDIDAVKNKHVYRISDENNFITSSPRIIIGIEEITKILEQLR